ncbi:MAG: prepilin-type N-terminal cleavage/methylation domain-containing protein [Pseudomonadales bacterium]|nr:prepilin-type N-terminal cleavage/methylation domain-containing protein [Pseudomonadales bacterium]
MILPRKNFSLTEQNNFSRKSKAKGFSLLEMIGVLAVMAIFAGALAPSVFQMIEESYQGAEAQSVNTVAQALQDYARYTKSIPAAKSSKWPTAVADYAGLSPNRVLKNDKNFERKLFIDPDFLAGGGSGGSSIFYSQDQGLDTMPSSPRIMLVSNLEGKIKPKLKSASDFDDVWNQTADSKIVESKTLFVERINLAPLFMRVVLSNANTSQAGYLLESGTEASVAAASGGSDGVRTIFVLAGSKLSLRAAPYPGGTTQRQLIVDQDMSLRFEIGGSGWYWAG